MNENQSTLAGERTQNSWGHTPGPWFVMANLSGTSPLHPMCSVWSGRETQESIVCNSCMPDNAKLIAAAPDMLAALHAAMNWFTPPNDKKPFPGKQIADAIIKAQ